MKSKLGCFALGLMLLGGTEKAHSLNADVLLFCDHQGDPAVMQVNPEDTLQTIANKVHTHFGLAPEEQALIFLNEESEPASLSQVYCISNSSLETSYDKRAKQDYQSLAGLYNRNYDNPVTAEEKANIAYIVNTLANTSYAKLLLVKGELERVGERIDHVHPLRHLGCIFTDEELKVSIRNIKRKTLVWKNYVSGLADSLTLEAKCDNLKSSYIADFAKTLQIDVHQVSSFVAQQRWQGLMDYLIDAVPRNGNPRRYDM